MKTIVFVLFLLAITWSCEARMLKGRFGNRGAESRRFMLTLSVYADEVVPSEPDTPTPEPQPVPEPASDDETPDTDSDDKEGLCSS